MARDVILTLRYLFAMGGAPERIRGDNGPEFIATEIQRWLDRTSVGTLYVQKAGPWESGYVFSHGDWHKNLEEVKRGCSNDRFP